MFPCKGHIIIMVFCDISESEPKITKLQVNLIRFSGRWNISGQCVKVASVASVRPLVEVKVCYQQSQEKA